MQPGGPNLVLTWTGGYILQKSTNLAVGFADVERASSPYTNLLNGPQGFFRLRSNN